MVGPETVGYGRVRYGSVRYGTVRYGTVRLGTVRFGTVRYGQGDKFGRTTVSRLSKIDQDGLSIKNKQD